MTIAKLIQSFNNDKTQKVNSLIKEIEKTRNQIHMKDFRESGNRLGFKIKSKADYINKIELHLSA